MDKNLITLDELQLYVTSQGNTNNDRVKTFLNNVFQMGFSFKYRDIFPMNEFEYGDLLVLDRAFIYKEYLKFLEINESYDDVLFHVAENQYVNFHEQIYYELKQIDNFTSHFKTRKQLIEEEIERKRQEEIERKEEEERRKKLSEENLSKESDFVNEQIDVEMHEASMMMNWDGILSKTPIETFEEKVFRQMEININESLQENIYARIRIDEHLKDIKKLRNDFGVLFSK